MWVNEYLYRSINVCTVWYGCIISVTVIRAYVYLYVFIRDCVVLASMLWRVLWALSGRLLCISLNWMLPSETTLWTITTGTCEGRALRAGKEIIRLLVHCNGSNSSPGLCTTITMRNLTFIITGIDFFKKYMNVIRFFIKSIIVRWWSIRYSMIGKNEFAQGKLSTLRPAPEYIFIWGKIVPWFCANLFLGHFEFGHWAH